jgi:2-keto-3-deoxy-L-rhamnonate aldolase RhmA
VYTEDKADVDTELIAEELGSDDIDAALPSVGSTPDQYEKLKQVLQTEGVTGVIVRREGAAELAQSIGRALGVI